MHQATTTKRIHQLCNAYIHAKPKKANKCAYTVKFKWQQTKNAPKVTHKRNKKVRRKKIAIQNNAKMEWDGEKAGQYWTQQQTDRLKSIHEQQVQV